MAAAELSERPRASPARALASIIGRVYLSLWAWTLALAALSGALAGAWVREALGLTLSAAANPRPSAGHVLALAAHNLPICAWPLLLALLRLPTSWRRGADMLVLTCALVNIAPVACALGAYGPRLLAFVPQLPLEWAALAVGYGAWAAERGGPLPARERLSLLASLAALVLGAAVLETYAVPYR